MKRSLLFLWIISLPFLLMICVNTFLGSNEHSFKENQCTRYCHDYGCLHFQNKLENDPSAMSSLMHAVYHENIRFLKKNPFGLEYIEMNMLLYVLMFPLFMMLLLWGLIRKRK